MTILQFGDFLFILLSVAENSNWRKFLFCFVFKISAYFSAFSSSEWPFDELLLIFYLS